MSAGRPSKDSTRNRLVVEGADDLHVVVELVMKTEPDLTTADPRVPLDTTRQR